MQHRMKLKYEGFEFELEGERDFVEKGCGDIPEMIEKVLKSNKGLLVEAELSTDNGLTQALPLKPISINEFLVQKKFANDTDRVMGVCYFIEKYDNKETYSSIDIKEYFQKAKYPLPGNISDCLYRSTQKGYLRDDSKEGGTIKYTLTNQGIDYVEKYIPSEKQNKPKKTKPESTLVESPLLEISIDKLNLNKYPEVPKIEKFREQLLCILKIYNQEANIEWFSVNDILAVLKRKFNVPSNDQKIRIALDRLKPSIDSERIDGTLKYKLTAAGISESDELIKRLKIG